MRFTCDKCSTRYSIRDEKIRGKRVAIRCGHCGTRIVLDGRAIAGAGAGAAGSEDLTEIAASDLDRRALGTPLPLEVSERSLQAVSLEPAVRDGWYAVIAGKTTGPLSGGELRARVQAGAVGARTYLWREGQGDWRRARELPEIAVLLPPSPAAVPAPPASAGQAAGPGGQPLPDPVALARAAIGRMPPAKVPAEQVATPQPRASAAAPRPAGGEGEAARAALSDPGTPLDLGALLSEAAAEFGPPKDEPLVGVGAAGAPGGADALAAATGQSAAAGQPIGEQTRVFMRRAGVTRRNPAWKIAVFVACCLALPLALLYLLAQLSIVDLHITQVDAATGEPVQTPVFSSQGLSGLRDLLMGSPSKAKAARARPRPAATRTAAAAPSQAVDDGPIVQRPAIEFNSLSPEEHKTASEIYQDSGKRLADPRLRRERAEVMAIDGATGGLEAKVINDAVAKNLRAFQTCNDNELRRNPSFKGGKLRITFTIGPSGTVTRASLDRPDIEGTALGACLREKAKRVVFPSFEGEAFDVEVPLLLTAGG